MSLRVIHVQIDGITHEAVVFESHSLLSLSCETWMTPLLFKFRKTTEGIDVADDQEIDCMSCLVVVVKQGGA